MPVWAKLPWSSLEVFLDGRYVLSSQPNVFLSYTRKDDEYSRKAITALRRILELGVQVVTGNKDFQIFQDIEGIEFGQRWERVIDDAISSAKFLVPVITPLFFQSERCRDELEKFLRHEQNMGRDDLILPIYFVTIPELEQKDQSKMDKLLSVISTRELYDWRNRADLALSSRKVRLAVKELSEKIASAIARTDAKPIPARNSAEDSEIRDIAETLKTEQGQLKADKIVQKSILWVDDNPDNNIYERKAMEAYNIKFELAKSTGEALAKLSKGRYDAIISDMERPPDLRAGYTLLQTLRAGGNLLPYFIYAGSRAPEHVKEALSRGAQGTTNMSAELINMVLAAFE